jgi:NADPH2:quinone reductase
VVAFEGRVVLVGFTSGKFGQLPTNHALLKNYSVLGLHWGLYRQRDPGVIVAAHADLLKLAADGLISPHVSEQVPLADAPAALDRLGSRRTVGKVVVLPDR